MLLAVHFGRCAWNHVHWHAIVAPQRVVRVKGQVTTFLTFRLFKRSLLLVSGCKYYLRTDKRSRLNSRMKIIATSDLSGKPISTVAPFRSISSWASDLTGFLYKMSLASSWSTHYSPVRALSVHQQHCRPRRARLCDVCEVIWHWRLDWRHSTLSYSQN